MTTYSAAQAISPAIERTKHFLFSQFRMGRFLKLALVAMLTEGGMVGIGGNFPTGNLGGTHGKGPQLPMPGLHWPSMPVMIGIAVAFVVIVIPLGILLTYLLIRLRFSFFDCVLRGQDRIVPAWRKYHRQAMRYLGLSLCIGLASWVVLIPLGYLLYLHFKPLFERIGSATPPSFLDILATFAVVMPLALLLVLVSALVDITMNNFVLPRMALEDASIRGALREVWRDVSAEPGQFALFLLLRFLISMAASIVGMIALMIPMLIVVVIGVVAALVLKAVSTTLAVVLGVPAVVLVIGLFVLAIIAESGTIGTFRRNYALLFYGTRYPQLAVELWPAPPAPWIAPIAPTPPDAQEGL